MRLGVLLKLGGTFQTQEDQPPPPPPYQHETPPPMTSVAGWKSPVPYLFGGLAAVLGLIAFALLILACSYWKLSGQVNAGQDSGDGKPKDADNGTAKPLQSSILVIMAGEEKPTFLATPAASRASSFGDSESDNNGGSGSSNSSSSSSSSSSEEENREKMIEVKMMMR